MIRSEAGNARSKVEGERSVVAGGDQREADAGIRIMQEGGNAIDAIVAAAFAGFVVEPDSCGLGGYGRLAIYLQNRDAFVTIDHYVRAPLESTADMFDVASGDKRLYYGWPQVVDRENEWGYRSIAVPGAVAGLCAAQERFGRLSLSQVMTPAIELADEGLEVTWDLALAIASRMSDIRQVPETAAFLLPDDAVPLARNAFRAGHRLDLTDLAQTLRRIACKGAAGFYEGPVAEAIVTHVRQHGGILSTADLASYKPKIMMENPLRYGSVDYITANDQVGYECLNILDQFPLGEFGPDSLAYRHVMAESLGAAFADNMYWYGDPDVVASPVTGLANPAFGRARADTLSADQALPRPIAPADPRPYQDDARAPVFRPAGSSSGGSQGTSQMAAMDQDGNVATLCTSLSASLGSLVLAPGTGVILNDSMQNFDPRPGQANAIFPGKMPIFAVPVIVASDHGLVRFGASGSGGYRIACGVLQTMIGHLKFGMELQEAIDHPRIHCQGEETIVDSRIPSNVQDGLRSLGHQVVVAEEAPGVLNFARVVAVARNPLTGLLEAGSSPAWSTGAAGW